MNRNLSDTSLYRRLLILGMCVALILIMLAGTFLVSRLPGAVGEVPAPVIQALANRNWRRVDALLNTVTPATKSPVLRMLKMHACLAVNRNNDALDLLNNVETNDQLATWSAWTREFATANPSSPTAIYLRGDALARSGDHSGAIQEFTRSLGMAKNDAMVLTARGVASAGLNQDPTEDFEDANRADPHYADAQTSYALMLLKSQDGAEVALNEANTALSTNPDNAQALFIRGWLELQKHEKDQAVQDITNAAKNETVKQYIIASLRQLASSFGGSGLKMLDTRDTPGTSIIAHVVGDDASLSLSDLGVVKSTADQNTESHPDYDVIKGDGYVILVPKQQGRAILSVIIGRKRIEIYLNAEVTRLISAAHRAGKQVSIKVQTTMNLSRIIIYIDGKAVWEVHVDSQGRIIWQGPPAANSAMLPSGRPDEGGAKWDMSKTQVNHGLLPISACYGLEYDKPTLH